MPYIGRSSNFGVRTRFLYTATASQTSFTGADTQNLTLSYSDSNFIDVHQNGVLLKVVDDYTATTGTSVVLATGATASDVIEITVYDVFSIANHIKKTGDAMAGPLTNIDIEGTELILDVDGDTSITSDTDDQIDIRVGGNDRAKIDANGQLDILHNGSGTALNIQLDGTSVGGLGVISDRVYLEAEGSHSVYLDASANNFNPGSATGTDNDGNIDLGASFARWKDFYVGGNIYIGGTGSANGLDDYEEGTWTPSVGGNASYHLQSGKYTKVGRTVHVSAVIQVNALGTGSTTEVSGFPFTSSHAGGANMGGSIGFWYSLAVNVLSLNLYYSNSSTTTAFKGNTSASGNLSSNLAIFGNSARVDFSITYETS